MQSSESNSIISPLIPSNRWSEGRKRVRTIMPDTDPLIKACKRGDAAMVKQLIEQQKPEDVIDYVNSRDKNGSTPLYHAIWPGHTEVIHTLLAHGAKSNTQNAKLNTPLHLAAEQKHHDIILLLITYDAQISLPNVNGQVCYEMVQDKAERGKMENFIKKCWADVRRGTFTSTQLEVPEGERPEWKSDFYRQSFYDDEQRVRAAQNRIDPNQARTLSDSLMNPEEYDRLKRLEDANQSSLSGNQLFSVFLEPQLKELDRLKLAVERKRLRNQGIFLSSELAEQQRQEHEDLYGYDVEDDADWTQDEIDLQETNDQNQTEEEQAEAKKRRRATRVARYNRQSKAEQARREEIRHMIEDILFGPDQTHRGVDRALGILFRNVQANEFDQRIKSSRRPKTANPATQRRRRASEIASDVSLPADSDIEDGAESDADQLNPAVAQRVLDHYRAAAPFPPSMVNTRPFTVETDRPQAAGEPIAPHVAPIRSASTSPVRASSASYQRFNETRPETASSLTGSVHPRPPAPPFNSSANRFNSGGSSRPTSAVLHSSPSAPNPFSPPQNGTGATDRNILRHQMASAMDGSGSNFLPNNASIQRVLSGSSYLPAQYFPFNPTEYEYQIKSLIRQRRSAHPSASAAASEVVHSLMKRDSKGGAKNGFSPRRPHRQTKSIGEHLSRSNPVETRLHMSKSLDEAQFSLAEIAAESEYFRLRYAAKSSRKGMRSNRYPDEEEYPRDRSRSRSRSPGRDQPVAVEEEIKVQEPAAEEKDDSPASLSAAAAPSASLLPPLSTRSQGSVQARSPRPPADSLAFQSIPVVMKPKSLPALSEFKDFRSFQEFRRQLTQTKAKSPNSRKQAEDPSVTPFPPSVPHQKLKFLRSPFKHATRNQTARGTDEKVFDWRKSKQETSFRLAPQRKE